MKRSIFIILILFNSALFAEDSFVFNTNDGIKKQYDKVWVFSDNSNTYSVEDVIKLNENNFSIVQNTITNLGVTKSTHWLKFSVKNKSEYKKLLIGIEYALLDTVELYEIINEKPVLIGRLGDMMNYKERGFDYQDIMFEVSIPHDSSKSYILKVKAWEQVIIPLYIGNHQKIFESNSRNDLIFGAFFGFMIFLILYNTFIFLSTKDISYIFYVLYAFFITLTQAALNGYTFRFLFPSNPIIANSTLVIFNSIAGISTILFIQNFLKTNYYLPKLNKGFYLIASFYVAGIIAVMSGYFQMSYNLMDLGGVIIAPFSLSIAIIIALKNNRSAKIFLLAWSFFLIGVVLFVLKNAGILPSNSFTNYTMTIGIAIEGILLSFALADRINIMRKEKDLYQQQAIEALEEKQLLIKEQNITLDRKVKERTAELNDALVNLKQAQAKLVESEKMASLGQLTAGIAHEINNPINFVSSNVFPLRQDINDLKQILQHYETLTESSDFKTKLQEINNLKEELDYETLLEELETIINGIEDGARRTAEIVSGLRNFSRLDQSEVEVASINDCIETTLKIIQSKLKNIHLIKDFGNIPKIECFPGKLNQLFLNTIDNAIHAIHTKNIENGELTIKTYEEGKHLICIIKDNGIGMDEAAKNKIFDPFFTTKEVGEGTGLGMSIVHGIVELHGGKMEISSEKNVGTEIKLILPLTLPTWKK